MIDILQEEYLVVITNKWLYNEWAMRDWNLAY